MRFGSPIGSILLRDLTSQDRFTDLLFCIIIVRTSQTYLKFWLSEFIGDLNKRQSGKLLLRRACKGPILGAAINFLNSNQRSDESFDSRVDLSDNLFFGERKPEEATHGAFSQTVWQPVGFNIPLF